MRLFTIVIKIEMYVAHDNFYSLNVDSLSKSLDTPKLRLSLYGCCATKRNTIYTVGFLRGVLNLWSKSIPCDRGCDCDSDLIPTSMAVHTKYKRKRCDQSRKG